MEEYNIGNEKVIRIRNDIDGIHVCLEDNENDNSSFDNEL